MNKKYGYLVKDTLVFAVGSFGSKLILFFLVPLYTNYMTTAEYGVADLVTSFSSLLMPITSLMISNAVIRFGMMKDERPEDVAANSFIVNIFSIIFTFALIPIVGLYRTIGDWKWYLCVLVILNDLSEIERTYLKVKNKNKTYALISILQTAILAGLNLYLLAFLHLGIGGYLLSNICAVLFADIIAYFSADLKRDLRKGHFDKKLLHRMIKYSSPLVFSNISWWVISSSDKIMINLMISASALGVYTAATKIPSLINVIIAVFNQAWSISSIREIESTNEKSFYSSVFDLFSTVLFGASLFFIFIIKPFMSVYVGNEFFDAWKYATVLLAAAVFYSISAFVGTLYAAVNHTKNDMWTTIMCAAMNVCINYFGIKAVGTWGAVLGTSIAYFTIANVRIIDIKRYMSFDFNVKKYLMNAVILALESIAVPLEFYPYITSIILIIIFALFNRKDITGIIRGLYSFIKRFDMRNR